MKLLCIISDSKFMHKMLMLFVKIVECTDGRYVGFGFEVIFVVSSNINNIIALQQSVEFCVSIKIH